jgi:hypothetical protein
MAPSLGLFHNFSHALMSDPISFHVNGERSLQGLSGLLDIEREEIDLSQLTAEQIFNFVAPAPTVVTNWSLSVGNFVTMADSAEDALNVTGANSMNENGLVDGEDGGDGSVVDDPPPKHFLWMDSLSTEFQDLWPEQFCNVRGRPTAIVFTSTG